MYNLDETPNTAVNITLLTNVARTVVPLGTRLRIGHFVVAGGAVTAATIIFRTLAGVEITRIPTRINETIVAPGWIVSAASGLEIITSVAVGDANVTAFFYLNGGNGI